MEKRLAHAYEKALALVTGGPVTVTVTNGTNETCGAICNVDEGLPCLVYVANRKKEGGQWMVTLALRDTNDKFMSFRFCSWLCNFEIIPEMRRKGQPTTYRFMGAERVSITSKQTVIVHFRTPQNCITFELSPYTRKPLDAWASATKSITEAQA